MTKKPTFDKQLKNYAVKSTDDTDPIFSGKFYDFLANLLTTRDTAVKDELKQSLAEVLEPWHSKLDLIISNQEAQSRDLEYLKSMAKENRGRIESLETTVDIHNRILDGHNLILKNLKPNKLMQILVYITLAISIITAGVLLFHVI